MRSKRMIRQTYRLIGATVRLAAVVLPLLCGIDGNAQTSPSPDRGFKPAGSYAVGDIETINTTNGNLMLHLPLAALPPGRAGLGAGVNLLYNSKLWDPLPSGTTTDSSGNPVTLTGITQSQDGGWRYGVQYSLRLDNRPVDCSGADPQAKYQWKLSLVFPDGSLHEMRPQGFAQSVDGFFEILPDGRIATRQNNIAHEGAALHDPYRVGRAWEMRLLDSPTVQPTGRPRAPADVR